MPNKNYEYLINYKWKRNADLSIAKLPTLNSLDEVE